MNVCNGCRQDFDDRTPGTWHRVEGWVEERRDGGANAVREKRYTGDVLCPPCAKLRRMGVNQEQTSLL